MRQLSKKAKFSFGVSVSRFQGFPGVGRGDVRGAELGEKEETDVYVRAVILKGEVIAFC